MHKASDGNEAYFSHDLMYLTPSKAESCPYIAQERKTLDRLNYLRQIVEQLPLYTNQGRDWHCVLCQQNYYGHKFCGIYSIEDVPRALPVYNHRSRSRFLLASEFDYPETPDILSHL
ncbi:putative zinc ribbon protein [Rahnella inusitata]|uniref:putative zinc ribbon protein n=1 Tax=Rahnella inusitata TaxID=58169 RepID=UPI0039BDCD02